MGGPLGLRSDRIFSRNIFQGAKGPKGVISLGCFRDSGLIFRAYWSLILKGRFRASRPSFAFGLGFGVLCLSLSRTPKVCRVWQSWVAPKFESGLLRCITGGIFLWNAPSVKNI